MNDYNFRSPFQTKRTSLKFISSIWQGALSLLNLKMGVLHLLAALLVLSSCDRGYESDWTFSSGVENTTLESPEASTVVFTPSADGSTVRITWPVVYGAGGYQFSLYIVDDPENPITVGLENEIIDGCVTSRPLLEDTKYLAVLKTLGNERYNNAEATSASQIHYSTLLTATVIPNGTDLYQYFTANPIVNTGVELGYELEAGGSYTMSGEVNFGTAFVTLRGDKVDRPTVTLSAGFKSQGGGTKFKFINFECSGIPTSSNFYGFTDIPAEAVLVNSAVIVTNPIVFQSCSFTALPAPLYWDNSKNYAVQTLLIKDCVAQMTNNGRFIYNQASKGSVKDFKIENSTVYKNNTGTDIWMQLATSSRVVAFGWVDGSMTYTNCTFYGFNRMHNSNNYAQSYIRTSVKNCLFLEVVTADVTARYILPGGRVYSAPAISFDSNTYWRKGAPEEALYKNYDTSGTALDEDPLCASPATGDFTVGNPNTVSRAIGDPRWF